MKNGAEEPNTPKGRFDGITVLMLYQTLRGVGYPPIVACHLLYDLIRSKGVYTKPKLSMPLEIRPLGNGETLVLIAQRTYTPEAVAVFYQRHGVDAVEPPTVRSKPGRPDKWDWPTLLGKMEELGQKAIAEGREPNPVADLRYIIEQSGESLPHDSTLQRRVRKWRNPR
jgi:hypothetical protein